MQMRYGAVLVAALALAGCVGGGSAETAGPGELPDNGSDASGTDVRSGNVTITYTASGFSPQRVTVAPGTTVTWVNEGSVPMWVASDVHPTHAGYDGTSLRQHCSGGSSSSFDSCQARQRYSFTFSEPGTYGYHNHERAAHGGTIVVQ